ncbi:MAG: hypothetical protein E7676_01370 [Ruminococcaceae bacterium]|nr:hypothetical protein [Oscillospiraceae bacterium]
MTKKDDSILSKIWDTMQMIGAVEDKSDAKLVKEIEIMEDRLRVLLGGEGDMVLKRYIELSMELREVCAREAFSSGVKFATAYLTEATKNIPDRT